MILITGAAGKTGLAIIQALSSVGKPVRALIHEKSQESLVINCGASEVVTGDLRIERDIRRALDGINAVYLICPNMCPDEVEIGRQALRAAVDSNVKHFVYHSVLHPQVEAMPHHWNKMRVEELIFSAGLNFTIIQPSAYMQNVLGYWKPVTEQGVYALPYAPESWLSLVDLEDVAEVVANVLGNPAHFGATYELVGTGPMSQAEVAGILTRQLNRPVQAVAVDRRQWAQRMRSTGMSDYAIETLLKMFIYYENFGLWGSPQVLTSLLGRPPRSFENFIKNVILDKSRG